MFSKGEQNRQLKQLGRNLAYTFVHFFKVNESLKLRLFCCLSTRRQYLTLKGRLRIMSLFYKADVTTRAPPVLHSSILPLFPPFFYSFCIQTSHVDATSTLTVPHASDFTSHLRVCVRVWDAETVSNNSCVCVCVCVPTVRVLVTWEGYTAPLPRHWRVKRLLLFSNKMFSCSFKQSSRCNWINICVASRRCCHPRQCLRSAGPLLLSLGPGEEVIHSMSPQSPFQPALHVSSVIYGAR